MTENTNTQDQKFSDYGGRNGNRRAGANGMYRVRFTDEGYDSDGYDKDGYDSDGFNREGYERQSI